MRQQQQFASVCVYCGSSMGRRPVYAEAASQLGRELARRGVEVVYGGGCRGLMGKLAEGALGAGGRVVGVMPRRMVELEIAHRGLTELRIVESMHERKAEMTKRADAFVVLPGAWGTLDEMCEAITWAQLGLHSKPCGLWNVEGYFDAFLSFLARAVEEGFLRAQDRELLMVKGDLEELLGDMAARPRREEEVPAKLRES
jgi:uncharacterized protein (TIGR00730 family)